MARGEFRGPYFVIGAARVRVLPGIGNVERAADNPGADFLAKKPFENVFVISGRSRGSLRGRDVKLTMFEYSLDLIGVLNTVMFDCA